MLDRSLLRIAVAVCLWSGAVQGVQAQYFFANESLGYFGTYTQYSDNTLSTQTGSGTIYQTDAMAYFSQNSSVAGPPPGSNGTVLQTITYVTNAGTNGPTSGNYIGNVVGVYPSNGDSTMKVFYDTIANQWNVTVSGKTSDGTSILVPVAGPGNSNPIYGTFAGALGDWNSFTFAATVSSASPPVEGPTGTYVIDQVNTLAATGTFHGVFVNAGDGKAYVVDVNINSISAARSFPGNNTSGGAAAVGFLGPLDGFSGVIPEPASCVTFALVLGASAAFGWRRRKRNSES